MPRPQTKKSDPSRTAGPTRTCIGCRTARPASDLVRLRIVDDHVVIDTPAPGRGASICRNESCISHAADVGAFSRAFRSALADRAIADTLLRWLGDAKFSLAIRP